MSHYVPLNDMTRHYLHENHTPGGRDGHIRSLSYFRIAIHQDTAVELGHPNHDLFFDGLGGTETTFFFGSTFSGNFILV